jgi:hypothetical protein
MDILRKYDSVGEYCADALTGEDHYAGSYSFAGGKATMAQTVDWMMAGASHDETRAARELLEKVDASFRDRVTSRWDPSVCGAYAVVPDYLMGMPENMRTRTSITDDAAPVRIFAEVVVSGGVSTHELAQRGAALAALVTRMNEERAVEFWGWSASKFSHGHNTLLAFKIDSQPVSLSQVVNIFATKEMARRITGGLAKKYSGGGSGWLWAYGDPGDGRRVKRVREILDCDPRDIVIEGGYMPDAYLMSHDPVGWVHKQIDKQREADV